MKVCGCSFSIRIHSGCWPVRFARDGKRCFGQLCAAEKAKFNRRCDGPFSSAGSVSRFSVHRAKITAFLFAGGSARRTARNVLYSADSSAFKNKGGLGDRDCSFCVFGVGIILLTYIQQQGREAKAGLILFIRPGCFIGQAGYHPYCRDIRCSTAPMYCFL